MNGKLVKVADDVKAVLAPVVYGISGAFEGIECQKKYFYDRTLKKKTKAQKIKNDNSSYELSEISNLLKISNKDEKNYESIYSVIFGGTMLLASVPLILSTGLLDGNSLGLAILDSVKSVPFIMEMVQFWMEASPWKVLGGSLVVNHVAATVGSSQMAAKSNAEKNCALDLVDRVLNEAADGKKGSIESIVQKNGSEWLFSWGSSINYVGFEEAYRAPSFSDPDEELVVYKPKKRERRIARR